ncbi:2'-5' RNA ligase family protein [Rivularia sp. UHCC 0363]|uniref:2'-5' RNA ligase family protein n=1 Tax=Rivularia sp. UHCC 0363 TaxID=3110244 RepID=UPI002B21BBC2|nr:2'-5' RNA ligase family protein [Rivularia sp. UHCC 0363]MEA5593359.1 2'-5' RNA ligase family protein [Rivularia sp. UHCC 0363]
MSLYFIALLPPQPIQDYANEVKQYFADNYDSKHAQKSPPHITLQPPFEWDTAKLTDLEECLHKFVTGRDSIPVTLNGYAAFIPRVIYIDVVKTPELLNLQADLIMYLETNLGIVDKVGKSRGFTPHMTVAFKDLKRENFKAAWVEFENRELHFEFNAKKLTLLKHENKRWNITQELEFVF